MKTPVLSSILFLSAILTFGQGATVYLIFTARNNAAYQQLDSIRITNRTIGGDTVLYWNDTMLSICYVGMPKISRSGDHLKLFQSLPDPVTGQANFYLQVPERDQIELSVTDLVGRPMAHTAEILEAGMHSFRFSPGTGGLCIVTARWRGHSSSIKILPAAHSADRPGLPEYLGRGTPAPLIRSAATVTSFAFNPGDELLFTGYANGLQSGIRDHPDASELYTFEFATNVPCPGMPSIYYEGQEYHTIQVFSQCWLKENLNVGILINPGQDQTDNGVIEKYCLDDSEDSCTKYGGYYQWDETMQYARRAGVQGICPEGWHIPDDEDWKLLEGAIDSQFGIGDPEWDKISYRGFDAGANLKSDNGWYANGNGPDPYGFSGIPAGYSFSWGYFWKTGREAYWWSSTEVNDYAWNRLVAYNYNKIHRLNFVKVYGFNVRCLRN